MALPQDGKQYILMNARTSTVVSLDPTNKIVGDPSIVSSYNPLTDRQVWLAHSLDVPSDEGKYFSFSSRATGPGMSIDGVGIEGGQLQAIPTDPNNTDQQWLLRQVSYSPVPVFQFYCRTARIRQGANYSMDLNAGSTAPDTPINLAKSGDIGTNANQVWMFIQVDEKN